jgi:hypothetical protein
LSVISCQKEELIQPVDFRDQLVGNYQGELLITNTGISNKKDSLKEQHSIPYYSVEITKSALNSKQIILKNDTETILTAGATNPLEFGDILVLNSTDCNTMETYQLLFDLQTKKITLNYKNTSTCQVGFFEQKSQLEGYQTNNK